MQVTINGNSTELAAAVTVADLLRDMNIEGKVAVEINREILPRSKFSQHNVCDGDILEIVHAIGGG
jgi:thiamine biosynthesis protein ThiS